MTNAPVDPTDHRRQAIEQIGLEAVGALAPAEEMAWVREHLDNGCPVCTEASACIASLFDDLLLAARPVTPPSSLRDRVLDAIHDRQPTRDRAAGDVQVWNRWTSTRAPGFYTLPRSDASWEATAIAGVSVRPLHVDHDNDRITMLVRMEAGTTYPPHRHGGDEECYVLEGDLVAGDEVLHAGDYQFAAEGSVHGVQSTERGCTLLIVSSRHDELLTA